MTSSIGGGYYGDHQEIHPEGYPLLSSIIVESVAEVFASFELPATGVVYEDVENETG